MTDLGAGRGRRGLFAGYLEERFSNSDLVVVIIALAVTSLIGVLSGIALVS